MTKKDRFTKVALKILAENDGGVRYSDLVSAVAREFPKEDPLLGTFRGAVWDLHIRFPEQVYKPERGLFRLTRFREREPDAETVVESPTEVEIKRVKESQFYEPFTDFLVNQLNECTKAIPLGGAKLGGKWGTPDVVGIYCSRAWDIIPKPIEVTSAEIKLDTRQLITAYGQACAYKLFSHRSYLVVPESSPTSDLERLDALCCISGIGLILFDADNPADPGFQIRVRALKHEPDHFHLNENIKLLANELDL